MYYVVPLGNPGEKYAATRHNVGWQVIDAWRDQVGLPALHDSAQYSGFVTNGVVAGQELTVLYPHTYMNHSGSAVAKLVPPDASERLVVVYDDVDLPLGEVKVAFGRGDGGHNGVRSIISKLGTKQFVRIRVGICPRSFWTKQPKRPAGGKLPKYVLGRFTSRERSEVAEAAVQVGKVLDTILRNGHQTAMNQHN